MGKQILFLGSYTEFIVPGFGGTGQGIYTAELDTKTGELLPKATFFTPNPSYLATSDDQKHLYAVSELDEKKGPMVKSFNIKEDNTLDLNNEQPITGGYACHIATHSDVAILACYATGNIIQYPIKSNGGLQPKEVAYFHKGTGPNVDRQEGPHAHQVVVHPNGKEVFVCDLGIDTLKAYVLDKNKLVPNPKKDCKLPAGSGPRHMVFNKKGDIAYVISELSGMVSVIRHQSEVCTHLKSYQTLPDTFKGTPSSSAIRIHPNGKYLYVGNRNLDAITIFSIKDDGLEFCALQYTQGEELREFNISSDGKWLIACHQNSHDTVVYQVEDNGTLKERFRTKAFLSPVCVLFN